MSGMRRAKRCIKGHAAETAVPVLCELIIGLAALIAGGLLQRCMTDSGLLNADALTGGLSLWDLWLPGCVLAGIVAQTPMTVTRSRILAELCGVLDADDLGFLRCCTEPWLWGRMLLLRLCSAVALAAACVPAWLLLTASGTVLRLSVGMEEAILPLMTAVHLLLGGLGTLLLPLRVIAAQAALPYCFLKNPHHPAKHLLAEAFARTAAHPLRTALRRLICVPVTLLPPAAIAFLPRVHAAELIEAAHAVSVHKSTMFSFRIRRKPAQSVPVSLAQSRP